MRFNSRTHEELEKILWIDISICHKSNEKFSDNIVLCGEKSLPCVSSTWWEKVTCEKCLIISGKV